MQSLTHAACCSAEVTMLLNTDGLCGPVMTNMFGKPVVAMPR